ncbi:trehalose receptor domain-containing protein [Ditylenchus destructor]|uniref:Trehalose receptor domain-containing protein n=1 Tax=Ditylenchus destructor TaxID=166010 RepID=A0AAD4MZ83_9BILA|nr:trehalose receptor domain-containing protein [Ditylenchus destructor]
MVLLILVRRKTWLGFYYSVVEMTMCVVHLVVLTVLPSQVHTEFKEAQKILYRKTSIWNKYDSWTFQIGRSFAEKISSWHVGISFGGFTVITKSLVLSCISLMVPYVLLCIQMHIGADNTLHYSVFKNITRSDQ